LATADCVRKSRTADGDLEFGRVYPDKRLLMADGNMQSRQAGEYAQEGKKVRALPLRMRNVTGGSGGAAVSRQART